VAGEIVLIISSSNSLTYPRHILQELTVQVPSYVPNDTFLVGGSLSASQEGELEISEASNGPSMLILTGPNYSGKSVYMKQVCISNRHVFEALTKKQVALNVYLAQVGRYVL
jgi:DNA mismatch repair protein MSH5